MIGDHHQQRVVVDLLHHASNEAVHPLIQILNHLRMLAVRHIARRRMIFVQITPEHVLDAVGRIEDAGAKSLLRFIERIKQHALAVFMIAVSLREKRIVVEHMLVQSPRIFRQPERRVRSKKFGQINGIRHRVRDRQIRMSRIDIHRSHVDFNLRRNLFEIKTADAMRRHPHPSLEFRRNPLGIFADLQSKFFGTDNKARRLGTRIRLDFIRHPYFASALDQRILWSWHKRMTDPILALDRHTHAAFAKLVVRHASRTQAKRALAAL